MDDAFILARLVQLTCAMVLGGASLFFLYGHRPGTARWPRALALTAAVCGAIATIVWLALQAARFSDGRPGLAVLGDVVTSTGFGLAAALRAAGFIVAAVLVLIRARWAWLAGLGGLVVASFAWTGHGALDDGLAGLAHQTADVIHLVAASIWIGALAALLVLAAAGHDTPVARQAAQSALERFSGLGFGVVAALALSGLVNGYFLVGPDHVGGLLQSPYGRLLAVKLGVFCAMLGLAALNRWRLTPRLAAGGGLAAVRASVAIETALALSILALVSWLGTLEPPING